MYTRPFGPFVAFKYELAVPERLEIVKFERSMLLPLILISPPELVEAEYPEYAEAVVFAAPLAEVMFPRIEEFSTVIGCGVFVYTEK